MMTAIGEEMESLREIFLLANSGNQVYRGYRKSEVLRDLAVREKKEVLVDEYRVRTEKEDRSVDDVVVAYAILVIASFLEYEEGSALFQRLDVSKLQWGEEVKRLYLGKVPTIYTQAHGKAQSLEYDYTASQIDTSYNAVRGKGHLEREREVVSSDSSSSEKINMNAIGGEEKK